MPDDLIKIICTALAGAVLGWVGTSMTLVGRVDAIEAAVGRIEAKFDAIYKVPTK